MVVVLLIALAAYEYRLRKPDQLVLHEADGTIRLRRRAFYPRHLSLALPGTTHQMELKIDGVARGSVQIRTTLVVTVAPSRDNLASLIRVGGWKRDAVVKAAKEFETAIQGLVKEFTERYLIEELSSEKLSEHLSAGVTVRAPQFGLELVSLTVQSVDPVDAGIAEAMRRRESARIIEQTELLNQTARIAAARAKLQADEQIALLEHDLELKKYDLRRAELEKEAVLADKRTEDELKRSRMKLAFESEELALLKSSPELLLLSPQAARLAEASQNLKNARTVVSLGPRDAEHGSRLASMFQRFLDLVLEGDKRASKSESEGS
ncbi:MAG: SPFH domain-containing protein [Bryobacterales bacterium]|nr:SPFH domain-containing protein [Bryobacterales bacterium]